MFIGGKGRNLRNRRVKTDSMAKSARWMPSITAVRSGERPGNLQFRPAIHSRLYSTHSNALASNFMPHPNTNLDPALEDLLAQARQAALNSYSPYSGFRVGAALRLTNGAIVTGTNVENVSYGLTICAERSALVTAVSQFGPDIRIDAVAVANLNDAASPPCGACRQMLSEFILPDAPVLFPAADGPRTLPFSTIFPLAFEMKLK